MGWTMSEASPLITMDGPCLAIKGGATPKPFHAMSSIPFLLADWVGNISIPPLAIIGVIVSIYFIGGFFMDSMALIVVTIPIFFPIVQKLGFDWVWGNYCARSRNGCDYTSCGSQCVCDQGNCSWHSPSDHLQRDFPLLSSLDHSYNSNNVCTLDRHNSSKIGLIMSLVQPDI